MKEDIKSFGFPLVITSKNVSKHLQMLPLIFIATLSLAAGQSPFSERYPVSDI